MAYAQVTRTTQTDEISVEMDQVIDGYVSDRPVNIWFGGIAEIYVSLSIAEAEKLADQIIELLKQEATAQ